MKKKNLFDLTILFITVGCGTCDNQTSEGGIISSPEYPKDYGNDRACVYTIRVASDQKIQLSFTVFHVEFHYDWIDVSYNICLLLVIAVRSS